MATTLDKYPRLKRAIQDWLMGEQNLSDIANHLNLTPASLKNLLFMNGYGDAGGHPIEGVEVQDVLNLVFLTLVLANRLKLRERG